MLIALFSVLIALFVSCAWTEEAAEPTVHASGDYEYVLLEDGTAEIVDYNGEAEELTIPDSVTAIEDSAFVGCEALTSITFTVPRNSWAAQYCKDNNLRYTYPDANDWLLN